MSATTADDRLAAAWEKARRLPDSRKDELVDLIELLTSWAEEDDVWEPDEEEEEAVGAWFEGERPPGIPWEEVKRQPREDAAAVRALFRSEEKADIPLADVMCESRALGDGRTE